MYHGGFLFCFLFRTNVDGGRKGNENQRSCNLQASHAENEVVASGDVEGMDFERRSGNDCNFDHHMYGTTSSTNTETLRCDLNNDANASSIVDISTSPTTNSNCTTETVASQSVVGRAIERPLLGNMPSQQITSTVNLSVPNVTENFTPNLPVNGVAFPYLRAIGKMKVLPHPKEVYSKRCAAEVVDRVYRPFQRFDDIRRFTVSLPYFVMWATVFPLFCLFFTFLYNIEWPVVLTWLSSFFE